MGSAIRLQAFEYELRGHRKKRKSTSARPGEAYLPKAVDRDTDSFAIAADQSPDISWLSGHYARILRSPAGRQGVGAQRFLVLLGAETAPRLRLHPKLEWRYNDQRRGLHSWLPGSPLDRSLELKARDATYTLQDRDCPTLATVAQDISRLRRAKQRRRRRAAALLATLARAWDRAFNDFITVDSARDYYVWDLKGQTPAYWLWEIGAIEWLDDESGTPRRPSDLRLRTHGNVAIYGQDSPDYLHPDLDQSNWRTVLAALGVSGDPSRSELVTRLKEIRGRCGLRRPVDARGAKAGDLRYLQGPCPVAYTCERSFRPEPGATSPGFSAPRWSHILQSRLAVSARGPRRSSNLWQIQSLRAGDSRYWPSLGGPQAKGAVLR